MSLISPIDSYYSYMKANMLKADPTQAFGGIANSRDWPQTQPVEGALYLLLLSATPTGGTESQNLYEYQVQWVWLLIGDDIAATQQAANRGDRYRRSMSVQSNLRQASYPGFCAKKDYAVDALGVVTGTPIDQASVGGAESVWWSRPRFMPRFDNQSSGVVYGAAAVQLYAYDDVLAAVAS